MARSSILSSLPLPKHSWPARQKEKLNRPGATDRFIAMSSTFCEQAHLTVPPQKRTTMFHHFTEGLQSICDLYEFERYISSFWDTKVLDSPRPGSSRGTSRSGSRGGSRRRHGAVVVGYSPDGLSQSHGLLFPLHSPTPAVESLRLQKYDAILRSSFLLVGDGSSRAFRNSGIPTALQYSLFAMGTDNFDMINPMKAFQGSSFNHKGCPLGLLSHLIFIYQCEIRDDGKATLSVLWVQVAQDEDDGSGITVEDGSHRLQYCKALLDIFDITEQQQVAKLFAWLHAINTWALGERLEAFKLAQQLDEARQRRYRHAKISILQDFGADLSTAWLSDQVLTHMTESSSSGSQSFGSMSSRSPATNMRRNLAKYDRGVQESASLFVPIVLELPPSTMAWDGLLDIPKWTKGSSVGSSDRSLTASSATTSSPLIEMIAIPKPQRATTASNDSLQVANLLEESTVRSFEKPQTITTPAISSSGREISAEKLMASANHNHSRDFHQRLITMTAIYDAVLQKPSSTSLEADVTPREVSRASLQELPRASSRGLLRRSSRKAPRASSLS